MKQFFAMMMLVAGIGMMAHSASAQSASNDLPEVHSVQSSSEIAEAMRERTENDFWMETVRIRGFEAYLVRYPNGDFADLATRYIDDRNRMLAEKEEKQTIFGWNLLVLFVGMILWFLPYRRLLGKFGEKTRRT